MGKKAIVGVVQIVLRSPNTLNILKGILLYATFLSRRQIIYHQMENEDAEGGPSLGVGHLASKLNKSHVCEELMHCFYGQLAIHIEGTFQNNQTLGDMLPRC